MHKTKYEGHTKDTVTAGEHNNIDSIESGVQGEEHDMQDYVGVCEYVSKTWQQKPLFELQEICNVILKGETKKLFSL